MSNSLPSPDDTLASYDTHAAEYADAIEGRADLEQIGEFAKKLRPGGTVVDVGCAAGRDTAIFAEQGFHAIGIDLSHELIDLAKQRHPDVEFIQADMLSMPFSDESVDGIWSRASLVHMATPDDTQRAMGEFFRVLKPGGVISVRAKARKPKDPETGHEADQLSGGNTRFFRYYTLEEITGYAAQSGFKVAQAEIYNEKNRLQQMMDQSRIRDINWVIFTAHKLLRSE